MLALGFDGAHAQSKSVVVPSRNGDVTVQTNGDMAFDEEWNVQFIGGRCIAQGRYDAIRDWGVSQNGIEFTKSSSGRAGTYELYTQDDQDCIKWHFAPTTDATRTFNLRYTVVGGLRIYEGGDQFFWNFIESDRQYPINDSNHLPGNAKPDEIKATTYENNSEQPQNARIVDGNTVVFTGSQFSDGDQWTLRAQFPHGIVNAAPAAWQKDSDQRDAIAPWINLGTGFFSLLALIGGSLGLYLLWYTRGRDNPTGVIAEYYPTPPTDDPPGVAGVLLD
ncbi:MAG: hypothetical protein DCC52_12990, partial [Chloroflexi bacterium]